MLKRKKPISIEDIGEKRATGNDKGGWKSRTYMSILQKCLSC